MRFKRLRALGYESLRWKHSGFNVHAGETVPPEAKADLEDLAHYILGNPFSVEKMTLDSPGDIVIYRSRLNAKINRDFEVFTPADFLAAITQHVPDKGTQMVRYYGWSIHLRTVRGCGPDARLGERAHRLKVAAALGRLTGGVRPRTALSGPARWPAACGRSGDAPWAAHHLFNSLPEPRAAGKRAKSAY